MKRIPWDIVLALLAGLGLGLVYSWMISPPRIVDAEPVALRADFKDQYRSAVAAAYNATGNRPRARARLSLLGDADPVEALNAQAQRMLASSAGGVSGEQFGHADQVAALALALDDDPDHALISTPTAEIINNAGNISTATSPPPPPDVPIALTETPEIIETQSTIIVGAVTPRPTRTSVPTLGAPFALTGQESLCDSNLPDGLLQVLVLNSNRRQLAGVEVVVTWDGGKEQFFTGLKTELGNGYADYIMTPEVTYAIQLARGSDVALGIVAPTCQTSSGETFFGGIKLTFQQP
ncbi:MAG: hypothetical protein EHM33_10470 [Chloroflexi bacterium]|nr:MAG: hypothetical protein EHM33_10470 [Chloroflexota bacterium]